MSRNKTAAVEAEIDREARKGSTDEVLWTALQTPLTGRDRGCTV